MLRIKENGKFHYVIAVVGVFALVAVVALNAVRTVKIAYIWTAYHLAS